MRKINNVLVTGGAGFIGSNLVRYVLQKTDFSGKIINLDKLTYAGNPESLADIDKEFGGKKYFFEKTKVFHFFVFLNEVQIGILFFGLYFFF